MKNPTTKVIVFFLLIMAIAIFFRFYKLNQIPPGLYPDVAINGNDALHALKTGEFRVFYPENNGREGLFINLIALSFHLFGVSVLSIKLVPAIIGVLTVLGMYFMVKELFGVSDSKNWNLPGKWKLELGNSTGTVIALLSSFFLFLFLL